MSQAARSWGRSVRRPGRRGARGDRRAVGCMLALLASQRDTARQRCRYRDRLARGCRLRPAPPCSLAARLSGTLRPRAGDHQSVRRSRVARGRPVHPRMLHRLGRRVLARPAVPGVIPRGGGLTFNPDPQHRTGTPRTGLLRAPAPRAPVCLLQTLAVHRAVPPGADHARRPPKVLLASSTRRDPCASRPLAGDLGGQSSWGPAHCVGDQAPRHMVVPAHSVSSRVTADAGIGAGDLMRNGRSGASPPP